MHESVYRLIRTLNFDCFRAHTKGGRVEDSDLIRGGFSHCCRRLRHHNDHEAARFGRITHLNYRYLRAHNQS